jgi:predicted nucleotidyltransferase component of viral defense system
MWKKLMTNSKTIIGSQTNSKSNLLREMVKTACDSQELAGMETTVEKELLHYDIIAALSHAGLLTKLVFQGGTCLRIAYASQRLSEDLDFVGGDDFSPEAYQDLAQVLINYFKPRYGLDIRVKIPKERTFKRGSVAVGRWMVSIETQPQAKDLPNQRIKLEVANIPNYSHSTRAIKLNYPALQSGLSTVLVNCETEEEILADKIVALCLRKFIKARDLWDLVMLEQQGLTINDHWVMAKFKDYKSVDAPLQCLQQRLIELPDYWKSGDFENEMRRFLPRKKIQETFEQDNFMAYFTDTINTLLNKTMTRWSNPTSSTRGARFHL